MSTRYIRAISALACACAAGALAACSVTSERSARAEAATTSASAGAPADRQAADARRGSSEVEYYTAAALDHVADSLSRTSSTGHRLGDHGAFQYLVIRRPKSGVAEVHDRWADVTVVQAGRGTLVTGGQVNGSRSEPDGEHRGKSIEGGSSRPVAAGI